MDKTEIEFVCYQEGGIIDLHRALDEFLPQRLIKLSPDDESIHLSTVEAPAIAGPFRPGVRVMELHHGRDDLLAESARRFPLFQRQVEDEQEIRYESLVPAAPERVYPFKRAVEAEPTIRDRLPATVEKPQRVCGVTDLLERDSVDRLPQRVSRTKLSLPSFQSQKSFHDQLMARARERQAERRRIQQANRRYWRNFLLRSLPETIIVGAIGAIAAGITADQLGIPLKQCAGLILASGLASASIVLLIKLPKPGSKSLADTARV